MITKITEMLDYRAEEVVFEGGQVADALYVIISGQVRIEQNFGKGRKKTLAVLGPGHFFGEMAIVTDQLRCASVTVAEDAQLLRVEKGAFLNSLKENNDLCFGILQVVCERLRFADEEISNLTFRNLPGRIVSKMLEMAEQFGVERPDGILIQLELTHSDLADMVGTNRESVSKYLSKFKKEGSIETFAKHILIKNRKLLLAYN